MDPDRQNPLDTTPTTGRRPRRSPSSLLVPRKQSRKTNRHFAKTHNAAKLRPGQLHVRVDGVDELGACLGKVDGGGARDGVAHARLVVEAVHLGAAVEGVHAVGGAVEHGGEFRLALLAQLVQLARRHAHELGGIVVEPRQPNLSRRIRHIGRQDVPVAELLLGNVDARLGDEVDVVLLQHRVEAVDGVVEARRLDLAAVVEQVDREELALAALVRPVADVRLGRHARLDGPSVLVGRQTLDRVDGHACVDAAATSPACGAAADLAGTGGRGGGRRPASRVVADVAVSERATSTALLLDTSLGLDGVVDVGRAANAVGGGRVNDAEVEQDEDASALHRVAGVLRDTHKAVLLELARLDHGSLLRGEHGLGVLDAVREDDAVAVAHARSGRGAGLDLLDAEDLAYGVLHRARRIGGLDHLGDGALAIPEDGESEVDIEKSESELDNSTSSAPHVVAESRFRTALQQIQSSANWAQRANDPPCCARKSGHITLAHLRARRVAVRSSAHGDQHLLTRATVMDPLCHVVSDALTLQNFDVCYPGQFRF
ncbi:hypothetical protein L1887_51354 [Cichorium endivia]|nr:hypothetical protein L1887_51354 [Cichorium endivia]